ncbi:YafY family protein [Actinomadura viridis]|uniref:DNA-binding transcriptional regulator YafY n=1 Tax=Actinomadura viridis TaxID=58110 RepID=A0A931DIQ9_9ACTN|nr:YafY family protein [Actinomadura viridis]MBG6089469.1 putative DNA-binding transcriptional regulator YafY [Actinomadura viridis]
MSHPTTRILAMLELLQANHRLSGTELARRLRVDQRTVRRYAARLEDLGVPVVAERGRHGGYRLMPGYKLPPLMLNDDEATAVVLGLLAGRRLGLPGQATETALAKVQRVLPDTLRARVQALHDTLGFTLAAGDPAAPATTVLLTLAAAARSRRRLRMRYRSWRPTGDPASAPVGDPAGDPGGGPDGDGSERDLDPYGLVFHSGRWYVTGHDHRSAQIRTFRVDRVISAEPAPGPAGSYDVPPGFDPVQHVTRSLAGVPYTHQVEVWLETTLDQARRRIPATVATLSQDGGGVLMVTRAQRLDGMAQMLAGLGWPFTIRRPEPLRAAVRDLADALHANAGR